MKFGSRIASVSGRSVIAKWIGLNAACAVQQKQSLSSNSRLSVSLCGYDLEELGESSDRSADCASGEFKLKA